MHKTMVLFSFAYADRQLSVELNPSTGEEILVVDGIVVAQGANPGSLNEQVFSLEGAGEAKIAYQLDVAGAQVQYQFWLNDAQVLQGAAPLTLAADQENAQASTIAAAPAAPKSNSWISLALVAFKLLKAVQVVKVALLAASVAVYSVMFTLEFALALIGVLVFHEYGHLRAMKKCGLPTKGMYLIPFVGGLAVGDMPKTRWQDVYISMMGPVYGLIMTVAFYIVYLITDSHFAGLVASTSALLNLFNLIPVYPLDGGRVVKSLVFSGRNYLALVALLLISALCFVGAWKLGLYFITFFIVLGVIDIVAGWRVGLAEDITPLKPYGIWFSVLWYLVVVAMFLGMIFLIAMDGLPGSEIALKVLAS
ncbi:site-2 protease family protein [Cellvibrio sp. NN19]|uniref:site-2 protease family protein n=1 Tax=Cellvibrio chitinivorans TaxID=3102792 RepID=UPI002B412205|nr:site-2 protease family protein [Cellvibrio sp. NN19]